MQMPPELQQLIQTELEQIRRDPEHDLLPMRRRAIYEAFDPSNEAVLWQRLEQEMEAVRLDPNLDRINKAMRRRAIYKALAPRNDPASKNLVDSEIASVRNDRNFHKYLFQNMKSIPDYYALLPELDPVHYQVGGHLAILTARHVVPIWKKALEDSEVYHSEEEDLFPEFFEWIEKFADNKSKQALLEILNQFPRDKQKMHREVAALTDQEVDLQWQQATLYLLEDRGFEARVGTFLAQGDKADWIESVRSVTTYDLLDYMLFVAEKVLEGTVSHAAARQVADLSGIMLGNIPEMYELSLEAADVGNAAASALAQVIIGFQRFNEVLDEKPDINEFQLQDNGSDAASGAVSAYANIYEDFEFIEVDLEKRLEFWDWWLTQAIPQAWELAPSV